MESRCGGDRRSRSRERRWSRELERIFESHARMKLLCCALVPRGPCHHGIRGSALAGRGARKSSLTPLGSRFEFCLHVQLP